MTMAISEEEQIEAEIARLSDLSLEALKTRWLELKGIPLPKFMRRELMTRAVAHAIRETALGGLDAGTQRRLDQLVRQIVPKGEKRPPPPNRIKAGTRLIREWRGRAHEVTVTPDGFVWQSVRYRSLSEIARLITGTRWNGWVFFGIKKRVSAGEAFEHAKPRRRPTRRLPRTSGETRAIGEVGRA